MNDVESLPSIPVELRHDHPHSSVLIWHIPRYEPLNEHTWVGLPSKFKKKKSLAHPITMCWLRQKFMTMMIYMVIDKVCMIDTSVFLWSSCVTSLG